eukprot:CAMPEP_0197184822 /NCGR_PEP_ID=MMETSP1423-20130617/10663_1 /TAXON_ID=476441 /ORGANISM="Pseudo-nitzschia heimii, Strain UNC1101" /LENGTH=140 /DNA_ID=CAMNT_0042635739 /DNA_START=145 /DNA_END=567 /DNA_ORIENTATION=+
MKTYQYILLVVTLLAAVVTNADAFAVTTTAATDFSQTGSSSFVISQRPRAAASAAPVCPARTGASSLSMGGKAKFGAFSPAVYGAKIVLGDARLKKYRGKAISIHSSTIGDFTKWIGAPHMRVPLIKLAKVNGNELGFLV